MFLMRKSLTVFVCSLFLLTLSLAETAESRQESLPVRPQSVGGTEWVGIDTQDELITTYRFESGGVLAYYYNGRSYRNGTWRQDGDNLYFEINQSYRECRAIIKGDKIEGDSWNKKGEKWKTIIYKYNRPA